MVGLGEIQYVFVLHWARTKKFQTASDAIFMSQICYFGIFSSWYPTPSQAGREVEESRGLRRGRERGPVLKNTHSRLWLFTSLWHVCGCFHGDGSKDSWDVSEIQCAERCWLPDGSYRMNRVHRKWERTAPALHYLSLNLWEKPSALFAFDSGWEMTFTAALSKLLGLKHTCFIRVNENNDMLHTLLNDILLGMAEKSYTFNLCCQGVIFI